MTSWERLRALPMQARTVGGWYDDVVSWLQACDSVMLVRLFRISRSNLGRTPKVQDWDQSFVDVVQGRIRDICQTPDPRFILGRVLFAGLHTTRLWDPESLARWVAIQAGEAAMDQVITAALIAREGEPYGPQSPDVPVSDDPPDDAGLPRPPVDGGPGQPAVGVHDVPCPYTEPGLLAGDVRVPGSEQQPGDTGKPAIPVGPAGFSPTDPDVGGATVPDDAVGSIPARSDDAVGTPAAVSAPRPPAPGKRKRPRRPKKRPSPPDSPLPAAKTSSKEKAGTPE